jgi:hypothetical protein
MRFKLRTLFVIIALLSVPMTWVAYQLNWIRERHKFLASIEYHVEPGYVYDPPKGDVPWTLKLFGEQPAVGLIRIEASQLEYAERLFPEANFAQKNPLDLPPHAFLRI